MCKTCRKAYALKLRERNRRAHVQGHLPFGQARCARCSELKSIAEFAAETGSTSGHFAWCKACVRAHDANRKKAAKIVPLRATCCRCRVDKPSAEFTRSSYRPNGLCSACRACTRADNRRKYHEGDKEARARQIRARQDPEAGRVYARRSNARRRASRSVPYTNEQWRDRLEEYGHRCAYCGRHESECGKLAIEHMLPLSRGGVDEIENVVPACKSCNSRKHARTLLEHFFGRFDGRAA